MKAEKIEVWKVIGLNEQNPFVDFLRTKFEVWVEPLDRYAIIMDKPKEGE